MKKATGVMAASSDPGPSLSTERVLKRVRDKGKLSKSSIQHYRDRAVAKVREILILIGRDLGYDLSHDLDAIGITRPKLKKSAKRRRKLRLAKMAKLLQSECVSGSDGSNSNDAGSTSSSSQPQSRGDHVPLLTPTPDKSDASCRELVAPSSSTQPSSTGSHADHMTPALGDTNPLCRDPSPSQTSTRSHDDHMTPAPGETNPLCHELVAIDCEMVGTQRGSALAQCTILSYDGEKLFHAYVRPAQLITDYRTRWSGIRPRHMKWAVPHDRAVAEIRAILEGKIMIGHDLSHDLKVIGFTQPEDRRRDTAFFRPLRTLAGLGMDKNPSLKKLSLRLLGREIQTGCHNSLEDARAALDLYRKHERLWESYLVEQEWDKTVWFQDCYWPHDITNQ